MPKSLIDGDVEKATSELNVIDDWQLIIDVCDRIKTLPNGHKDGLKAIMKRVNHAVPHVAMQALTLLAAAVNNCGKDFHLEICSREWTAEAKNTITRGHTKVSERLRELIEQWANLPEFKNDPQLNLMVQFYKKLKADGFGFSFKSSSNPGPAVVGGKLSSAPAKGDEDEDLNLAIAMSLQEAASGKPPSNNWHPSSVASAPQQQIEKEICQVRALYDFEAAEDNEMTFKAGEIFSVLDNSDENWWKGRNERGVGLFPANFVSTDLRVPEPEAKAVKKKVHFADQDAVEPTMKMSVRAKPVINEVKLDVCLNMLKKASPTEEDDEEGTIRELEENCREMGVLIEKKVLECERRKSDLEELNKKFIKAISMYQAFMKEPLPAAQPPPVYGPSSNAQMFRVPAGQAAYTMLPYQTSSQPVQHFSQLPQTYPGASPVNLVGAVQASVYKDLSYSSQGPPSLGSQLPQSQTVYDYSQQPISYAHQQQFNSGQFFMQQSSQQAPAAFGYSPGQAAPVYNQTPVYQ